MKAVTVDVGHGTWQNLELPLPHITGPFDLELYRRRSRGEEPLVERDYVPVTRMRTVVLSGGPVAAAVVRHLSGLVFVATGAFHISLAHDDLDLVPGDLALIERPAAPPNGSLTPLPCEISTDPVSRLIQFDIDGPVERDGDWIAPGTACRPAGREPNFKQIHTAPGGTSSFSDFDALFPKAVDTWSDPRPTVGLHFGDYADHEYMGLHPSVVNQLVLVLTGCMELGLDETDHIERFYAGDAVLAADRTGQGHTDLFRGRTALANVVIENAALWPVSD